MLQRITLYTALGLTLNALGAEFNTWGFWCVVGLFWASEHLTRIETVEAIAQDVARIRQQRKDNNNDNNTNGQ
jgi:hypothetical protein